MLFRLEEHVDRWCSDRGIPRGAVISPAQCWELAKLWDIDRLQSDWRRKTVAEVEAIFERVGLGGPFWTVRP